MRLFYETAFLPNLNVIPPRSSFRLQACNGVWRRCLHGLKANSFLKYFLAILCDTMIVYGFRNTSSLLPNSSLKEKRRKKLLSANPTFSSVKANRAAGYFE
jgi:hypothetical protein